MSTMDLPHDPGFNPGLSVVDKRLVARRRWQLHYHSHVNKGSKYLLQRLLLDLQVIYILEDKANQGFEKDTTLSRRKRPSRHFM